MAHRFSETLSVVTAAIRGACRAVGDSCCAIISQGQYHPEAYYMRGPGPKWREKHSQTGNMSL
jgi:hypothetical protein